MWKEAVLPKLPAGGRGVVMGDDPKQPGKVRVYFDSYPYAPLLLFFCEVLHLSPPA